MKKSIINFRNTYFSMILIIAFFVVLSLSYVIVGIVFEIIVVFMVGFVTGLVSTFIALYLFFKTIYKVTFFEDKVVFSRFNKVYRVFYKDKFTLKKGPMLKNDYGLLFQDEGSPNEKQGYAIDYCKRNRKILKDFYSIEI